jgi:D-alanyl-D-alanine carboxypeptidase
MASSNGPSQRRVPGSGIASVLPPRLNAPKSSPSSRTPRRPRPALDIKPRLPKQWRHVAAFVLAILVAGVGIDNQGVSSTKLNSTNQLAASTRLGTARAADAITSLLPTVKSIELPPIPIKKAGVKEPAAMANGVILIDDATKLPLYVKAGDTRRSVASTTKIVTALVVSEHYKDLDRAIPVSASAVGQIGSVVGFRANETVTFRQLLHGLLMVSGNDAAKQLSELYLPVGGEESTASFVAEMNRTALSLGMTNSHFYDPAGLKDEGYSTPADMAKAFSALLKKPLLTEIVKSASYEYRSPEEYVHTFKNSNRLVTDEMYYPGIIGGKTGFTPETAEGGAGHCMIVAAERDGHRLIVAVLGTYSTAASASAEVAKAMLDYGFTNFTWTPLAR